MKQYKIKTSYYSVLGSAYPRYNLYKKFLFFWWFIADFGDKDVALSFIEHLETKDEIVLK